MNHFDTTETSARALLAGYLPETEVAAARGVTVRALRAERQRGEGPPFVRISRTVYYPREGFRQWLKAIEVRLVRSAGKAA